MATTETEKVTEALAPTSSRREHHFTHSAQAEFYALKIAIRYERLMAKGREDEANALFDLPAPRY